MNSTKNLKDLISNQQGYNELNPFVDKLNVVFNSNPIKLLFDNGADINFTYPIKKQTQNTTPLMQIIEYVSETV